MRITGMVSGLDTDSLVKELVSAQKMKNKKLKTKGKTRMATRHMEDFKL